MYHEPIKGAEAERRDELGNTAPYRKRPHRGSDWGFKNGSEGKPVYAVADGVVAKTVVTPELGFCIITKNSHDKVYTIFCHLQELPKFENMDRVIGGETVIGHIGNTGSNSTGAHLHAAASLQPKPHLAPSEELLDLFKLIDADKPKPAAKKPATKKAAK
jgi:murein DD-endopeptidase MepM/ murein hydrolase activator NlpD